MTKRIRPIFPGERPDGAPDVLWVADEVAADDVARRVPGAVGFVDLDRGVAHVQPGTLTDAEVLDALAAVRSTRAGG